MDEKSIRVLRLFGVLGISVFGLLGAVSITDDQQNWIFYGSLYVFLLLLGMFVSTLIETTFDDRIEAQELDSLMLKSLSEIQDPVERLRVSQRIKRKCAWIKATISLFVAVICGLTIADAYNWTVPGLRLVLATGGLSAFGPILFLNFLKFVIRLDYRSLLLGLLNNAVGIITPKSQDKDTKSGDM